MKTKKQALKFSVCLFLAVFFMGLFCSRDTYAASNGTYKNMTWAIDDNGVLTLGGTLERCYAWDYNDVTQIVIQEGVTQIPADMFGRGTSIAKSRQYLNCTLVHLPDSLLTIGNYAFYEMYSLKYINFPKNLQSIGKGAFMMDKALTSFTLPDSLTNIGDLAFADCAALTYITIPGNVSYLGEKAFEECSGLTSAVIGKGCTYISKSLFAECRNLKSVSLPEGITVIKERAFYGCSTLETVNMPSTLKSIEKEGFSDVRVKSFHFHEGLTSLGDFALAYNSELSSVSLPDSLTQIGEYCFRDARKLKNVTLPPNLSYFSEGMLDGCGISTITIPGKAKGMGRYSLYKCPYLKTIIIENGVKTIDAMITSRNNLERVFIPKSVTSIGTAAFGCTDKLYKNCYKLKIIGYSKAKSYAKTKGFTYLSPKSLKVKKASKGVSLSWGHRSGATSYKIYRISNNSNPKLVKTIKKAKTRKFTDKSAKSGNTYQYYIYYYKGKKLIGSSWIGKIKR